MESQSPGSATLASPVFPTASAVAPPPSLAPDTRILAGLVTLRSALALGLWLHAGGFFWLTGDDAARMNLAFLWSQDAFFNLRGNPSWLPLGTWVHGAVLRLWSDPLAVSAAVNTAFSLVSMVLAHRLTRLLFPSRGAAALCAAAIVGFTPWLVWLGLSGLSEPIFHCALLAGVVGWLYARRRDEPHWSAVAGVGFLAASAIRYEGWLLALLFAAGCLLDAWRRGRWRWRLTGAALALSFVPLWLGWQWLTFGDPFHFAAAADALASPGSLAPYVQLLVAIAPGVAGLSLVGLALAVRRREAPLDYLVLVALYYLGLVVAMRGTLAGNLPIRNLTSVFVLLAPFAGLAVAAAVARLGPRRLWLGAALLALVAWGGARSFEYRFQARDSVVDLAGWARRQLQASDGETRILVEVRRGGPQEQRVVWDSMFLHAVHPGRMVYDREPDWQFAEGVWTLREEGNPSLLGAPPEEVRASLRARDVGAVIAHSPAARAVLGSILRPLRQRDEYHVYGWPEGGPVSPAGGAAPELPPANLVVVCIDTLRAAHLGFHGYHRPTSPRLDLLATEGVVFERAQAHSSWTVPAVASLLTSLLPSEHGAGLAGRVRQLGEGSPPTQIRAGVPTLATLLGERGFATGLFSANPFLYGRFRDGFDQALVDWVPASALTEAAIRWLPREANGRFFLYIQYMDLHPPLDPPSPYFESFQPHSPAAAPHALRHWDHAAQMDLEDAAFRRYRDERTGLYDGALRYVDAEVGRLLDALAERGLLDRSVVVVTADHGEELWDHAAEERLLGGDPRGMWGIGHGHSLYQELLHVPLLVRGPGVAAGRRVGCDARHLDVAPTALALLGLETAPGMRGESLAAYLDAGVAPAACRPLPMVSESPAYGFDSRAVVWQGSKLIVRADGTVLLFDLARDPGERRNLAEQQPAMVAQLRRVLAAEARGAAAAGEVVAPDDQTVRQLRALGYLDGGP